jgi:hypothetical protein
MVDRLQGCSGRASLPQNRFKQARGERSPRRHHSDRGTSALLGDYRSIWQYRFLIFSKTWYELVKPSVKPRTAVRWIGILNNHLKPYFKGTLRSIASSSVENYTSYRIEAGANPQTVNRELAVLRHMVKRAARWQFLDREPITSGRSSKKPRSGPL